MDTYAWIQKNYNSFISLAELKGKEIAETAEQVRYPNASLVEETPDRFQIVSFSMISSDP